MKQIKYIHELIRLILRKYQQGWRKSEEIDLALHSAQMSLYMERLGNPAEYQPGRPIPRIAYPITQKIREDLRPFIKRVNLDVPASGILPYPENYVGLDNFRTWPAQREVDIVDGDKIAYRLSSEIVPPTADDPMCEMFDEGFGFYPASIGKVRMTYLRLPAIPRWAYDVNVATGELDYNDSLSVDIEFPAIAHNEIVSRTLKVLGINLKDGDVANFAQSQKVQGS